MYLITLSNGTWRPTYEVGTRGCWWKRSCASSSLSLEFRPVSSRCCCLVLRGHATLEIPKVSALIRQTISVREAPTPQKNGKVLQNVQSVVFCYFFFLDYFFPQSCASIKPCTLPFIFSQLFTITLAASVSFSRWSFCYYMSRPTQSGVSAVISTTSAHDVSLRCAQYMFLSHVFLSTRWHCSYVLFCFCLFGFFYTVLFLLINTQQTMADSGGLIVPCPV